MDSVFHQAIRKFESRLTEEQRLQLPGCSREDVEKTIADIQARWGSQRRLRNMNRLSKFLEGMTQLGHVVEVFLNVDRTVAMIWGPIKCLLLIANTWLNGLEKLLETYAEIGESLPPLKEYQSLFKNHSSVLSYLESYYCDILEFHSIAFDVFARPVWKEVFRSSWKTFETRFGPILRSMRRHKTLLNDEKLTAISADMQDFREDMQDRFVSFAKHRRDRDDTEAARVAEKECASRKRKISAILDKLDPPEYLIDQEYAVEQWQSSDSGAWALEDPSFRQWLKPAAENILYLNGIPGAGKSVLVSRIIHYLQEARLNSGNHDKNQSQASEFSLVYFYFKHQEPRKRQLTDLLVAVAAQIIQQDDSIVDHVYSEYCAGDQAKLRSSRYLLELVQMLVRAQKSCVFVLDGLDECIGNSTKNASDECEKVLDAVLSLLPNSARKTETNGSQRTFRLANSTSRTFRLIVSGQRNGFLDHKFEGYPAIHLEKSLAHSKDIDAYTETMITKIARKFPITQDTISLIFEGVHNESKGMFLYAKIVLNNLLHQVSIRGLERELHTRSFPKGLHEAYERVVASVFDNPHVAERDAAMRIIKLVAVAERPLRWREIQAKFCINVDREISDPKERIEVPCKTLCRSLVDVVGSEGTHNNANDTVHIVHNTALDFLVQTGRVSPHIEHARMATFCGLYLSSDCLRPKTNAANFEDALKTGYLVLHEYVLASWFEHFAQAMKDMSVLPKMDQSGVKMAASKLKNALERHASSSSGPEVDASDLGIKWLQGLHPDHRDRFLSVPALATMIESTRTAIETAQMTESGEQGNLGPYFLYGPPNFKCPKPWCEFYFTGFADNDRRKQHIQEHDTPFRCEEESCYANSLGFSTEKKLKRHILFTHSENIETLSKKKKIFPDAPSFGSVMGDLCTAAADGNLTLVKTLVKNGRDLNAPSEAFEDTCPLNLAAEYGHLQICQFLLQSGAEVNCISPRNMHTPLIIASRQGDMDLVNLLLDQKSTNIWHRDRSGWSALGYAVSMGHIATVHIFMDRLEKKDLFKYAAGPGRETGLSIAFHQGKEEIAQMFLQHVPSGLAFSELCGGDKHSFHALLKRGKDKLAQMLMRAVAGKGVLDFNERDEQGMLPLHAAIIGDCRRMITLLVPYINNVDEKDAEGLTPFQRAISASNHIAMAILLDHYPINVAINDAARRCCIMLSIGQVPASLVHRMLRLDSACLKGRDWMQASLLHYACYYGDVDSVRILLASGEVDVNATMSSWPPHWTIHWPRPEGPIRLNPITCAMVGSKAGEGRREIVEMLLATRDCKFPDNNQMQLLQTCSSLNDGLLLWRLIDQGLRSLSPTTSSPLGSPTLEEMVKCLLKDQLIARTALEVNSALVEQTLKDCFERLVNAEPHNAAPVLLEAASLFPYITTFARARLAKGRLLRNVFRGDLGNKKDRFKGLLDKGLTLADVISYGDNSILEWAIGTGCFDVNETHQGRPLFVEACMDHQWPLVVLLLDNGAVRPDYITEAIDKLSSVQSDEASKRTTMLKRHLQR